MAKSVANQPSASQVSGRLATWHRVMEEAGLSYEDLQTPIDNSELRRRLVQYWKAGAPGDSVSANFPITLDYDRRLERMIADGKYDWKNSDINPKNFPIEGKGKVEVKIELVHFNHVMGSDDVLKELDKQGLRPATLPELLAFGATYPEKQREFPIVALGSVWRHFDGLRYVAYLWHDGSERGLLLRWLGGGWDAFCRFAAVRK